MNAVNVLVFVCLLSAGVSSCKKEKQDYREPFIGTYVCTRTDVQSWPSDTTTTSNYIVTVSKGTTLNAVKFSFLSSKQIEIAEDGTFSFHFTEYPPTLVGSGSISVAMFDYSATEHSGGGGALQTQINIQGYRQ